MISTRPATIIDAAAKSIPTPILRNEVKFIPQDFRRGYMTWPTMGVTTRTQIMSNEKMDAGGTVKLWNSSFM